MSIILINRHLLSTVIVFQRSLTTKSSSQMANHMKKLNDTRQYQKTIQLFHENKSNQTIDLYSRPLAYELLKACTHLNDIHLGTFIHQQIKSNVHDDKFILFSLMNLYGKIYTITFCSFSIEFHM